MNTLLLRIAKKIIKSGAIDGADVIRLLDYNTKHPMWRVTANDKTVASFDAVMANVNQGRAA